MKNDKGFTLIELVVVIVIIGILSVIALPKLFGLSAKAKAAEVMPVSLQFEKLQGVYYMELSRLGDFTEIGFALPSINAASNFSYSISAGGSNSSQGLLVTSLVKLNNCLPSSTWTTMVETTSGLQSSRSFNDEPNCAAITSPLFKKALNDL
jgi:type IV pilus assembly protein PilA